MKTIKYICLALVSLLATSCMDLDPKAQMGDNLVWNKADNFQLFANQFYGWTRDFTVGVSDSPHSEYRSDLVCTSSLNIYSQGTNSVPSSDGNYGTQYKRIYYTNLLLKNAESFADKAAIATPMGEALFFRAYAYFELVQLYGDAILITEPIDLDSEKLTASQDDRGVVIDQCVADLQKAAELLPDTPKEEGRLAKDAALSMLSRVALYEGTWQKFHNNNTARSLQLLTIAKDAAKKVIDNGHYSLFYNEQLGNESYRYMFTLEDGVQCNPAGLNKSDNHEYILSHRHRNGDKMALNITHAMIANVCYVTSKMADMYLCSDGLPVSKSSVYKGYVTSATDQYANRDNRMTNTLLAHGVKYFNNDTKDGSRVTWDEKDFQLAGVMTANTCSNSGYLTRKWGTERQVADYYESYDYPVIRYAEVLLNYAEAAYELDNSITDKDLDLSLNLVRQRINKTMPKLSNAFVTANGLDMREEIRRERTVELFLEGYRIDDLKRWATAQVEMAQDQLGVKVTGTWYESHWTGQSRALNPDGYIVMYNGRDAWKNSKKLYLYPLPSDQLQLNPGLKQNPGWE